MTRASISQRILVLGASGFIGTHLVDALRRTGHTVVAATRTAWVQCPEGVENAVNSFIDASAFEALLEQCDAVVHAAAHSTPGSSTATPQLDGDLRTTLSLLEALQSFPQCRLLFLSSAGTLYGDRAEPATEFMPLHPRSYHGAGKAAAEHFIRAWASQHGGTAIILRPSNVYGSGQRPRHGFAIVPTAMRCARDGTELHVYGRGAQVRDYLHVHDLVTLCTTALSAPLAAGTHVFNAASGVPISLSTLLTAIEEACGRPVPRRYVQARAADISTVLIDPTLARETFGWQPSIPLDQGLAYTWEWVRTET